MSPSAEFTDFFSFASLCALSALSSIAAFKLPSAIERHLFYAALDDLLLRVNCFSAAFRQKAFFQRANHNRSLRDLPHFVVSLTEGSNKELRLVSLWRLKRRSLTSFLPSDDGDGDAEMG